MSGIQKFNITALMYHGIACRDIDENILSQGQNIYIIKGDLYDLQMMTLRSRGYKGVPLNEIKHFIHSGKTAYRQLLITHDDGYISDALIAAERLTSDGNVGNFFITTDYIGKKNYLNWGHIKTILESGHIIGSHGMSHNYFSDMSDDEIVKELDGSKKRIEDHIGKSVTALSLPGGRGGMRVIRLARKCGYFAVMTSSIGPSYIDEGMMVIGRHAIKSSIKEQAFLKILEPAFSNTTKERLFRSTKSMIAKIIGNRRYDSIREKMLSYRCGKY